MMLLFVRVARRIQRIDSRAITAAVIVAILTHLVEISVFALGIQILVGTGRFGQLISIEGPTSEYLYYSAVTYTTLGYGDITPVGAIRFVAAAESLTGLVLSAWTASLLFASVQRFVGDVEDKNEN